MEAAPPNAPVLEDLVLLAAVLAAVGFATYHLVYRAAPLLRWSSHGTVPTAGFGVFDLGFAALLTGFLVSFQSGATGAAQAPVPEVPPADLAVAHSASAVVHLLLIGAVPLAYLGFVKSISLSELFGLRQLAPRTVALWTVCGIAAVLLPVGLASGANHWMLERAGLDTAPQGAVQFIAGTRSPVALTLMVLAAVVAAPLAEEVLFRGFLYPVAKRFSDRFFAAFLSGLLFALAHSHLGTVLPLLVLGVALAAAFEITGSLLVPIGMHALFNALSITAVLGGFSNPTP